MQGITKKVSNRLVAGFAALAVTTVMTAGGFVGATGMGNHDKPSREECRQAGFRNHGQCVKEWAHHKNRPGGGYNGNTSVVTNISLTLNNSNNNIIQVVVNVFR
jgi:hypothetical protein